ncbi:PepSY-associated TM helix domain-containing protein [Acinetobacter sp. C26M]|uniref:PepSY-associated TM helix domain-containing protein n=1 Tax=unclassified Acinetobacter TaxID=196816 RepID=UPI002036D351|nr:MULTISPECIES: PepSY-associated TM helix domain-containing protein [unclassified Acinetobacter]USA47735.1 PepSY-associated TM helix domain-containing protein [Acinetobacter sp. C26M]USA51216.1 PepSY-associated TM helix domain-containing protein [Acinetobacter sp. C26G]
MYQRRDFYRHARYVHGWLSAFAFIALIFFAATGLFLNNPDWFKSSNDEQITKITLPPAFVSAIQKQENPSQVILDFVRDKHSLIGRYKSSEVMDGEVMIRLESPAGSTDLWVLMDQGEVEITQKPATTVSLLNDLHRGKNVGATWHWLIDISAIIIILLSLAGYILFLTIKTRLITHLLLTAGSLAAIILLIWFAI